MTLIFDFDGTICDSLDMASSIINTYLAKYTLPKTSSAEIKRLGLKGLISKYKLSIIQLGKLVPWGRRQISQKIPQLEVFPDLPRVLHTLARKHSLGIITTNSSQNVRKFLQLKHLENVFSFIDDSPDIFGKHHKLTSHKGDYYIGDETRDVEAAKKAGIKSIAVTWGYESRLLLLAAKPDIIISRPVQLIKKI